MSDLLFPMSPRDHIARIRRVLENEKFMRQRVFQKDLKKLTSKVREVDEALESLGELERVLGKEKPPG